MLKSLQDEYWRETAIDYDFLKYIRNILLCSCIFTLIEHTLRETDGIGIVTEIEDKRDLSS